MGTLNEQVYKSEHFVVRVHEVDGELQVYAHRVVNGEERQPLGYLLGDNALIFTKRVTGIDK